MPARRRKGWVSAGRYAGPAPIPALRAAFAPPVRMRPREGVFEEKTRKGDPDYCATIWMGLCGDQDEKT